MNTARMSLNAAAIRSGRLRVVCAADGARGREVTDEMTVTVECEFREHRGRLQRRDRQLHEDCEALFVWINFQHELHYLKIFPYQMHFMIGFLLLLWKWGRVSFGKLSVICQIHVFPCSFFHFADAPDRVRVKGPSRIRFDESARFTCLATPSRPAPDLKWRVGVQGQVRGQSLPL